MRISAAAVLATVIVIVGVPRHSRAQPAATAWPMFHHDTRHTGLSTIDTSTNPGELKWTFGTTFQMGPADLVYSSPAIGADGTIYVGLDQSVCAVNPDGTEKWKFTTGALVASSPAIAADGTIYVGSQDGYLYALIDNGTHAAQKWAFSAGTLVDAPPTIGADGTIYFGAQHNFYAVNADGTLKWSLPIGGVDSSAAAIGADGTIYFGTYDGNLWAITDGGQGSVTKKWTFGIPGPVNSSPAIGADGTIYFESQNGNLYAVTDSGADSVQKWAFSTGSPADLNASPAIGADGSIYVGGADGRFYAITDAGTSATEKWALQISAAFSAPAISADGTIYVSSDGGGLYAIRDDRTGATTIWSSPDAETLCSSPAIGPDGTIYVGSAYDNLDAIGVAPAPVPVKLKVGPRWLGFGTLKVGRSKTLKISVRNPRPRKRKTGLTVQMQGRTLIGFNSPFSVTNGCIGPLPVGAKCEIGVTFEPYSAGPANYTLAIYDNADREPQVVRLRGRGK